MISKSHGQAAAPLRGWLFLPGLFLIVLALPVLADDFEDSLKFSAIEDYPHAAVSFRKAADRGNADAQFNLALMYEEGRGIRQSYRQAARWFQQAADQNHAMAQSHLGKLLFEGKGVTQDKIEAYKWLSIARDKNKRESVNLAEMASKMTPTQISEARLRKEKWLVAHLPNNQTAK